MEVFFLTRIVTGENRRGTAAGVPCPGIGIPGRAGHILALERVPDLNDHERRGTPPAVPLLSACWCSVKLMLTGHNSDPDFDSDQDTSSEC